MAPLSPSIPALVTGASSGIGAALARQLAARGHDLVVVARRGDRLEALRADLESRHGVTVTPLVADLETSAGMDAVCDRLRAAGPWLLVSNAGFGTRGRVVELPVERETAEVMVNTVAMHRLCCVALQVNAAHREGGIITTVSLSAFQPIPYMATYAATKAFMLNFSEALAVEAREVGVRVMALCPGPVRTEFIDGVFASEERGIHLFLMDVEQCVRIGLRDFDRGHTISVPGVLNHATALVVPHIPRALVRGAGGRFMRTVGFDRTPAR
jgi:short-subunit dehydrogenase